jgi:DNA-binding NarL/FixJ family response regulator
MIELGIIEDNEVIRQSLIDYFANDEDVHVVAAAPFVDAFFPLAKTDPQVLLLDLYLPHKNGKESIRELCDHYKGISIIIHSVADDYDTIFFCLCNGAQSYLTKGESLDKVKETVLTTFHGGSQMSVEIARKVVEYFSRIKAERSLPDDSSLNDREKDIVRLIVEGKSYKMVAAELHISINTVRKYIKSVYRKLNINTNMELANIYLKK